MRARRLEIVPAQPAPAAARSAALECVLACVRDRWVAHILLALSEGPLRFNALKRAIEGVSQRMLTLTLRGLERDGLVSRTVTPTVPPRVDYALTALGRSLQDQLGALGAWALRHEAGIRAAQREFDGRG